MGTDLTYLESADSIRVPYEVLRSGDDEARAAAHYAELQLFLEMVGALAMGRRIVVPQSFAFDSHVFHRAAKRVWDAYEAAGRPGNPPIQLHLHQAASFDDAVSSMIDRATDDEFQSSTFPELSTQWRLKPSQGVAGLLRQLNDDDPRKPGLETVATTFRYSALNPAAATTPVRSLGELLARVLTSEAIAADPALHSKLNTACGTLNLSEGNFTARSALRSPSRWPGGPRGQSARDLVGDEALALLIETVDTLYNRTVAWSTGARFQLFTTKLASIGHPLREAALAQGAAVGALDESAIGAGTAFDVVIQTAESMSPRDLDGFLRALSARPDLSTGLSALFTASTDPESDFRRSLARLGAQGDAYGIKQHTAVVAKLLGRGYSVGPSDLWSGIAIGIGLFAAGGELTVNPPEDALTLAWIGLGAGASALALMPSLIARGTSGKSVRQTRRALGSTLRGMA